jgi:hypothetical protein
MLYCMAYYPTNLHLPNANEWTHQMLKDRTQENIAECNARVRALAEKYGYRYIDVNDGLIDENGEQKKGMMYKAAYYLVDGEQLRNWFPAETLGARRIYSCSECFVRIARLGKKRLVFDRHSMLIVISGTVLMGLCSIGLCVYWLISLGLL